MSDQQRPTRQPDLDEISINSFLIHNGRIQAWLKGEGVVVGNHFELVTWRREGLLARLRMRGFNVRTIEDRIAYLPRLPEPAPVGEQLSRELQNVRERFAHFDPLALRWRELEPEPGQRSIQVHAGWVLRRRRGRGRADYFLAYAERNGNTGLQPLSETAALLMGYAQATAHSRRPISLESGEGGYHLSGQLVLPPPHREIFKIITARSRQREIIPPEGLAYVRQLLKTLKLQLQEPAQPDTAQGTSRQAPD